jgi:ArsR family transcriptional regulator, arsenate/arsenite/antimonite-responsive transcriptional repressor
MNMDGNLKKFTKVMKALSDPNRVKIVKLLQHKSNLCVCELRSLLGIAQPTVSKHLKTLEEAGLVEYNKDGLWVNYSLASPGSFPSYAPAMLQQLTAWLEDDPEIAALAIKAPFVSREQICRKS